ncbi:MAG TPA: hypothetical protein VK826_15510, partial [Bacteroidia bacterium]|nr:hypothetical protein [Bacteroidia bacterium]
KFNGENRFNERVKPSATSAMNFFVVYKRNTVVVLPQLQLYVEHTDGYSVNESMQPGSAMSMIMGGAGCDAYFGRLGAHISLQLPIAQKEIPDVPGATFRGVVGLSWNINQTNYLLD